ncbi:MAG: hypothetical protein GY821_09585 [Gammaproteobacteria bacterium]|nr:hypothetical protein [Gammaproteobacteria bacterium]
MGLSHFRLDNAVKHVIFQKKGDGNSNDKRDNDLTRNSVVISGLYFTVQGRIVKANSSAANLGNHNVQEDSVFRKKVAEQINKVFAKLGDIKPITTVINYKVHMSDQMKEDINSQIKKLEKEREQKYKQGLTLIQSQTENLEAKKLINRVESALTEPTLSHHGTCDVAYRGFRLMFNKTLS